MRVFLILMAFGLSPIVYGASIKCVDSFEHDGYDGGKTGDYFLSYRCDKLCVYEHEESGDVAVEGSSGPYFGYKFKKGNPKVKISQTLIKLGTYHRDVVSIDLDSGSGRHKGIHVSLLYFAWEKKLSKKWDRKLVECQVVSK